MFVNYIDVSLFGGWAVAGSAAEGYRSHSRDRLGHEAKVCGNEVVGRVRSWVHAWLWSGRGSVDDWETERNRSVLRLDF